MHAVLGRPSLTPSSLVLAACLVLSAALPGSASAASEQTVQRYAEAVDFLDRWRGDRRTLDEAHERLTQLLIEDPGFAPGHVEMARWYLMNSRNHDAALRSLDKAQALDSGFAGTYVLRGYIFERQGRLGEALAELSRAEQIGTDNPWLELNRAAVFEKQGRIEEALALYGSVFLSHPEDPKAWPSAKQGLIQLHEGLGDATAVEDVMQQAQRMKPDDREQPAHYAIWLAEQERFGDAIAVARATHQRWADNTTAHQLFTLLVAQSAQLLTDDQAAAREAFEEARRLAQTLQMPIDVDFDAWAEQALLMRQR